MDDTQGTMLITNPGRYMANFSVDGHVSFQLGCNRGTSSWEIRPSSGGESGMLQFGPITSTRAVCQAPRIDERVVHDMNFVRGYLLKEGKMFMSLMADGGIYEWRPQALTDYAETGQVLGMPIHTEDAEELRYIILRALTDRYASEQGLTVSQTEVDAYLRDMRATLMIDPTTESIEDRVAREQFASAFIRQWKINQALYLQCGGRVIYQQGGPEPLDAYREFLHERKARGDFSIADTALETAFWRYYHNDSLHSFYQPGKEEEQVFAVPFWQVH